MSLDAGRLRHRVTVQYPEEVQDTTTGAIDVVWRDFATVWAAIEPLSVREFMASASMQSEVTARIVIRTLAGIDAKMRVQHGSRYYGIKGILMDADSGLEYMTLAVSDSDP